MRNFRFSNYQNRTFDLENYRTCYNLMLQITDKRELAWKSEKAALSGVNYI